MPTNTNLDDEEYFHGLLPREDLPFLLVHTGDFLVRISEPKAGSPRQIIISVMRHIVVQQAPNGKFMTDPRKSFDSVPELVEYFRSTKEPVISKVKNAILLNAIKRAPWELKHEDINLKKKLGEGAFGEVHSGKYKLPSGRVVDVAVKLVIGGYTMPMPECTQKEVADIIHEMCWALKPENRASMYEVNNLTTNRIRFSQLRLKSHFHRYLAA
ncbi:unnamed protein product [Toxocara canis]|uniref:SH2 domain-containing protein n=1 Tax=Toxocara canis TaxID=6265 RepID=A0A183UKS5_TOXCA|nr:unnamed protein product [Toxocara canis]